LIADKIQLVGSEVGPTYEVVISRTCDVSAQTEISVSKHRGALEQGCTESIMVGEGSEIAHGQRGSGKECTWSEGVQNGRRGIGEAMESLQGGSEVLGADWVGMAHDMVSCL
jgi:hypothetical protein